MFPFHKNNGFSATKKAKNGFNIRMHTGKSKKYAIRLSLLQEKMYL